MTKDILIKFATATLIGLSSLSAQNEGDVDAIEKARQAKEAADKAVVGADNWALLSEFNFKPEAANTRISHALVYFLQLLFWVCITALLLKAAVRRLNP